MVSIASRTRTFDCSAAQEKIGYSPIVSLAVSLSWPLSVCGVGGIFSLSQLLGSQIAF